MASCFASSSSSTLPRWSYDVFLSSRGEDTRKNFTDHLYEALVQAGIRTFRDDDELPRGREISSELLKSIKGSRISIVVFSRNYASSRWCLDELVNIIECKKTLGQLVRPIFYDVDPSDVRNQTGCFGEAFGRHEKRYVDEMEKVEVWRAALSEAANLSGWDLQNVADGHESKFIRKIVEEVLFELKHTFHTFLNVAVHPVGIDSRVEHIKSLLSIGSDDVRMIGIYGMIGIGKTTIAKAVYNHIFLQFEESCFLANVREVAGQLNGLVQLQKQLLFELLGTKNLKTGSVDRGFNLMKERLYSKKVLIVLDDVDQPSQLETLAGNRDWFGLGSRIIITTRDEHLLKGLEVDERYMAKELNHEESLQLFSLHAFGETKPLENYADLANCIVSYASGLPLALVVLGSYLSKRNMLAWKSALDKLRQIPHEGIQEKLRMSFDALDDEMKDIFLDIAFFFIGMDKDYAITILNACGFFAEIGISALISRCLLRISKSNKLMMHDLLRDMGREVIRETYPKEPEKRSRLWFHEDVCYVLEKNKGTEAIEGVTLTLPVLKKIQWSNKAFAGMHKLRLLQINHVHLSGNFEHLFEELRWLCWHNCPLEYLPSNFHPEKLVVLDMQFSRFKTLRIDGKHFKSLKILILSNSKCLTKSPIFCALPMLEELLLESCTGLMELHESIGLLDKLVHLNLKDCMNLRYLPGSICKLKSVERLNLTGCAKLEEFPEHLGHMESLTELLADGTAIKQLPLSIGLLKNLRSLSLNGCNKQFTAKSWFFVISSWVLQRKNADSIRFLPSSLLVLCSLTRLDLSDCNLSEGDVPVDLRSLSSLLSHPSKLEGLLLNNCTSLQSISDLLPSLLELYAFDCASLEKISDLSKLKTPVLWFRNPQFEHILSNCNNDGKEDPHCFQGAQIIPLDGLNNLQNCPQVSLSQFARTTGSAGGMEEDLEGDSLVHLGRSSPPSSSGRSSSFGHVGMSSGTSEFENSALKKMALERDGELSLAEYERLKEMQQKARDKMRFSPSDEEFLEKLEGKDLLPIQEHYLEEVLFAVRKQKSLDSLSPEEQEFKSIEQMTNFLKLDSQQWNKKKDLLINFILSYPIVADQVDCFRLCQYTSKLNPRIRTLEAALKKKDIQILRDSLTELNDLLEVSWNKFCMSNFSSEMEVYLPRGWSLYTGQLEFCSSLSFPVYGKPDCPDVILNWAITSSICLVSRCIMEERMKLIAISGHGAEKALKALKDIPEIQNKFDVVLYISVSQHHSNEEVQMDITKQIHGHEFPPGTDMLLPLDELLKPYNFLLMLDFIDGRIIDLYDLNIPFDHGCIVLATKSDDIYQIISVDLEIRMEYHLLPWELFRCYVGHVFHSSSTLQEIAICLIEECHGHLLAMILLARALKDVTDVGFWELALNELMLQPSSQVEEGMSQVMVRVLKFIWKSKGNITKRCIEHYTTYGEGRIINEASLISCWLKDCLVETKEEGEVILADLIDSFLLEHFNGALRMREETRIVLSKQIMPYMGLQLTEGWMVKWNAERINLIDNGVSELPESPICSNLVFLFLQKNCDLMVIPPLFFECMPMLQVLDLSYTSIKTLPASISRLVSLQKLLLRGCELFTELPPEVGELSILQVLDMEGTEIMYLPEEIKELKNLLLLKLSFYSYGNSYRQSKQISKMIPHGVLSDLFLLRELSIDVNPEDKEWIANLKDIIYELQNLKSLTKLKLYLPKVELLKQLTVSSFRFTVGRHEQRMISRLPHEVEEEFKKHETSLRYINGEHIPTEIKKTLKRTSAFFLDRHWTVKKLSEFGNANMINLKLCLLVECNELKTIIDEGGDYKCESDVDERLVLGSLEYLGIYYMKNLRSVYNGPIVKGCLSKLKFLRFRTCTSLNSIFTPGLLGNLENLEELIVEDCPKIKSLVSHESTMVESTHFLPALKKMSLLELPELVSISSGLCIAPKLERLVIFYCPKLESLSTINSKDLKVIKGESEWWDSLMWNESEWSESSSYCQDYLASIFVPLRRERNLKAQLAME
ncbi:hypothetical protein HYC85_009919 [Camellia sinensis]|uniref:TIR domain-containing protein n=1 Tax=Camellia sinensis TaxID=4442 RepID=A0A7J7HHB5_CAMSI|nr:hypothetical protein HYC85_009919 [Camellia sinensis]